MGPLTRAATTAVQAERSRLRHAWRRRKIILAKQPLISHGRHGQSHGRSQPIRGRSASRVGLCSLHARLASCSMLREMPHPARCSLHPKPVAASHPLRSLSSCDCAARVPSHPASLIEAVSILQSPLRPYSPVSARIANGLVELRVCSWPSRLDKSPAAPSPAALVRPDIRSGTEYTIAPRCAQVHRPTVFATLNSLTPAARRNVRLAAKSMVPPRRRRRLLSSFPSSLPLSQ
jgi:hypothetical protein